MWFFSMFARWRSSPRRQRTGARQRPAFTRLLVERLEDRVVPSLPGSSVDFGPVTHGAANASADWPSSGHDLSNTGYNAGESALSAATAAKLQVSWQYGDAFVVGTPVTSKGVAYFADALGVVHAVNAATGDTIWATQVSHARDPLLSASFLGAPVVTRDAVFIADTNAVVYRLNNQTGIVEWATQVDRNPNALIEGDPIVFDGQVLLGISSHENEKPNAKPTDNLTFRGSIVAVDAGTGKVNWQTFTTSDQTLPDPKYGAGVGVWSSAAIDPQRHRLYIGTGNLYEPGSNPPSPASRNDRDRSDSLLEINTENGVITQQHQFTTGDIWSNAYPNGQDFDVGAPPNLFTIPAENGHGQRDVVGVGDKQGTYYVMDRSTLQVIWSRKVSQGSLIGGIQSTAAIANGIVYVAGFELPNGSSIDTVIPNRNQAGAFLISPEGSFLLQNGCKTNVFALDAATGQTLWSRDFIGGATFAPLVVAGPHHGEGGDVLFMGDAGGRVRGLNAATGADLFYNQLTLTLPNPNSPSGFVTVGQDVTALSVASGRLYAAHGVPIPGLEPGGVTVFALPPEADIHGRADDSLKRESQGALPPAMLPQTDFHAPESDNHLDLGLFFRFSGSASVTVSPAAASNLLVTGFPSAVGVPFSITVMALDTYGNVATGYTGTVHFTTDLTATLPPDYIFAGADHGVHTFTGIVARKSGTQTITVTDTLFSAITGSDLFTVP